MGTQPTEVLPGLWRFSDSCNVYLVIRGHRAIAIDFGSGMWMSHLTELGVTSLEHVFLTHHHREQCAGLQNQVDWPFQIHAPVGEQSFIDPERVAAGSFDIHFKGCPDSYDVLRGGIPNVRYDMVGFSDLFWGDERIRFLHTPGHGPNACSVILDHAGMQVVFSGDVIHAGATIWQPYHLEWDHWTGSGVLSAWEGVTRLHGIAIDALLPSHGPVIIDQPRVQLQYLARKLLRLYHSKGQISPGEPDMYVKPEMLQCGAQRLSPHLYHFGTNGYLLRSETGEVLVIDPFNEDMPALDALLIELGDLRLTVATATHYHADHCDGVPVIRERYRCRVIMHPWVAEPLVDKSYCNVPWLPHASIIPDDLWPVRGEWNWCEYRFNIAPWPGQTHWHCVFMTEVDGQRVAFGGDSFQPASRWNGTGGYCAYNASRFEGGFIASAELIMGWMPDLMVCGHGTFFRFRRSKFIKILRWARVAEKAVTALCPSGDLEQDYYVVNQRADGFFWTAAYNS